MPFGPEPLGFGYFVAAKFAGYSCYSAIVNRSESLQAENAPKPNALLAGLLRTLIGAAIGVLLGISYWRLAARFSAIESLGVPIFFALLLPVRIFEWYLLWYLLYRKLQLDNGVRSAFIFAGIIISFALDAVGTLARLVGPGGVWVC